MLYSNGSRAHSLREWKYLKTPITFIDRTRRIHGRITITRFHLYNTHTYYEQCTYYLPTWQIRRRNNVIHRAPCTYTPPARFTQKSHRRRRVLYNHYRLVYSQALFFFQRTIIEPDFDSYFLRFSPNRRRLHNTIQ